MNAAVVKSVIPSRDNASRIPFVIFLPCLRNRIRCWIRILIAELLCATSSEIA